MVQKDGTSLRSHLESVQRQTGVLPKELAEIPSLPDVMAYLWDWFLQLDRARGGNGFGLNPLSYVEIQAWAQLVRLQLEPWEVEVLKRIDSVRVKIANTKTQD